MEKQFKLNNLHIALLKKFSLDGKKFKLNNLHIAILTKFSFDEKTI